MSGAPGTLRRLLHRQKRALENLPANLRRELALRRFAARERPQLLEARRRHEADHLKCDLPLVSIVINTYCRGPLLAERTLPSILAQTHQNFEIVIVGDCCIDDTPERMARIKDPRLRFHNLPERAHYPKIIHHLWQVAGAAAANHALATARGQWIAHLDDDDVLVPTYLEQMLRHAREHDAELLHAQADTEKSPGVWRVEGSADFPNGRWPHRGEPIPHSTVMFRSYLNFFRYDIDAWKYDRAGDVWMWHRMTRAGVRSSFVPKVGVLRPLRPDQIAKAQATAEFVRRVSVAQL